MKILFVFLMAFFAASSFAQYVPLILEETTDLPTESDVWDVMPHPDGYYVWVEAIESDTDITGIHWGRSNREDVDTFRLSVGAPYSITTFFRNDYEPSAILTSRYYFECGGEMLDTTYFSIVSLASAEAYTTPWSEPPFCYVGWPIIFQSFSDFRMIALIPFPLPPMSSTRVWGLKSDRSVLWLRDNSTYSRSNHLFISDLLNPNSPTQGAWNGQEVAGWCLHDSTLYLAGSSNEVRYEPSDPSRPRSYYGFQLSHNSGDTLISDGGFAQECIGPYYYGRCNPSMISCTYDSLHARAISLGGNWGGTGGIVNPNDGLSWRFTTSYNFWFAAECVPNNSAEEFLCYNQDRRVFDVLDAATGQWYGVTDTISINTSGARIVGRYDNDFRRLVIRDSLQLKLYRFGEYLASDERADVQPRQYSLSAYPNPFNPSTTIEFTVSRREKVAVKVYDLAGRYVRAVTEREYEPGTHRVPFDGSGLPTGIYFARIETAAGFVETEKLLLLR